MDIPLDWILLIGWIAIFATENEAPPPADDTSTLFTDWVIYVNLFPFHILFKMLRFHHLPFSFNSWSKVLLRIMY